MFREFHQPKDNLESAIESQDYATIIDFWRQSPELQEEIIPHLRAIHNDQAASELFDNLNGRFAQASDIEKRNILASFEHLGFTNHPAELATTDFLVDVCQKDFPFLKEALGSLKGKVFRDTLERNARFSNRDTVEQDAIPILVKSGRKFLEIVEGDFDPDLKKQAAASIWRCKGVGFDERLIGDLKMLVDSQDEDLSYLALGELFSIIDNKDEYLTQSLQKVIDQTDLATADRERVLNFILMAEWTRNKSFLPFLEELERMNRFPDEQIRRQIASAKQAVLEGKDNEK